MNKEKIEFLEKLILESELSQEDKDFWKSFISFAPSNLMENISDLLVQFPEKISWLTQMHKRKRDAFSVMLNNKEKGEELLYKTEKRERQFDQERQKALLEYQSDVDRARSNEDIRHARYVYNLKLDAINQAKMQKRERERY